MASKIKTNLSEGKSSPQSQRVAKLTRLVTKPELNIPSPTPHSRLSLDRSNSKSSSDKRSPKVPTEKTQTRLIHIKEDLRKANELIVSLENENVKALDELKEAREEAEEASMKLVEALKAQQKAEEDFEIEKFKVVEEGIEAVQRKEEELNIELENVKQQHALDSAALLLVTRELAVANDAKSKVMSQADEASKMVAIHEEKVEILSSELIRLKALLDSTREKETISNKEIASKLGSEIMVLKRDLDKARSVEVEQEKVIEKLIVNLEAAKMAESHALDSADEWQKKARELERQLEEANELKRSTSVSLESVTKQLQGSNDRLFDMESEITDLKNYIRRLETTVGKQKEDLEKSEHRLEIAEEEAIHLKNELETVSEEHTQTLKKEQDATSTVSRLLEERNKILSELESSKEEEEKSKKAMESLASALHEVSSEARELKEKLLNQVNQDYETQIEDLKLIIKATNEKYENMLGEARHEIDVLVNAVEQTKTQFESSMVEWEMREAGLVNHVKKFDEEVSTMGKEMNRLGNLLKRKKEEADAAWKKESQMRESLKEVEDEVIYLQETLREVNVESFKLKEKMLDKETEFQSIVQENDELRVKENDSLKKIKLLEEALAKKESNELSESEKDYDLLPKVVKISEENGHGKGEHKKEDSLDDDDDDDDDEDLNMVDESKKTSPENMEESKNAVTREDEFVKEEKKKKKTTLFGKVGNLLKKKGSINQK